MSKDIVSIAPQQLQQKMAAGEKVVCVDVRTEAEHDLEHIPGSRNIPLDQLQNHLAELKKYDEVILSCQSGSRSQFACNVLPSKGVKVCSLQGGLSAWDAAGLPVERKGKVRLPLMRQVFLIVGPVILAGVFLTYATGRMSYLVLPLLVGLGLSFAGATGQCLMTKFLIKMPWNK